MENVIRVIQLQAGSRIVLDKVNGWYRVRFQEPRSIVRQYSSDFHADGWRDAFETSVETLESAESHIRRLMKY